MVSKPTAPVAAKAPALINNYLRFVLDDGLAMPTSYVGWFGQGHVGVTAPTWSATLKLANKYFDFRN